MKDIIEITGTYMRTVKKDFTNGYTIFSFSCKNFDEYKDKGKLFCAGYTPVITRGIPLKLTGYFDKKEDGKFLFVINNLSLFSDQKGNTIDYLLGDRFKGIGPKTAQKIVDITGPDIFSFIKQPNAKERLSTISELKGEKIDKFFETINETFFEKEIYEYLRLYGGDYLDSQNIYNAYKNESIKRLKENPYETGKSVDIPFIVCDAIAKENNIFAFNDNRLRYMVISAMYNITNQGHTSASLSDIYYNVCAIAKQSAFPEYIPTCTMVATTINKFSTIIKSIDEYNKKNYTLKEFADAEDIIVDNLYRFFNNKKSYHPNIEAEISLIENKNNIIYSESQRKSFNFLNTSGFKVLTGGPGTGKTTVINGIIEAYQNIHPESSICLCAPTGRAAQKIKESTNHPASTIHRLLNLKPYETKDGVDYDVDKIFADLIIVDEFSMVDLKLFAYLTNAIKDDATVILCGDSFQLPSVGAGNVLYDIIATKLFEVVNLDIIYRQKENSKIISFSQDIKNGILKNFIKETIPKPTKLEKDNTITLSYTFRDKEIEIIKTNSIQDIHNLIVYVLNRTFLNRNSKFFVDNILDLQVLSSTKKDIAGTVELNKAIHYIYQKGDEEEHTFYSVGDKIMMMENNYETGYCNGDIGFVKKVDSTNNTMVVEINGEELILSHSDIKDVSLSYACTIHKSQGSEYDYVIISLPKEPISILQRNLIYTAVTRAKKYVAIIYEDDALSLSIKKNNVCKRKTNLKNKILEKFKESLV